MKIAMVVPPDTTPRAPKLWKQAAGVDITLCTDETLVDITWDALLIGAPYKIPAMNWYPSVIRSEDVATVGAMNLIVRDVDAVAYNTDVYGFQKTWEEQFIPHDARVLVVGAGALGRAALHVLRSKVEKRWVWDRTPAKAHAAFLDFLANPVPSCTSLVLRWFEVVVNTTPLVLPGNDAYTRFPIRMDPQDGGSYDVLLARHAHAKAMSLVLGGTPESYLERM